LVAIAPYPSFFLAAGGEKGGEGIFRPGGEGIRKMTTRIKKQLTAKFCANVSAEGEYLDHGGPVPGLILKVGATINSKSWLLRYRYQGKRREMGLGSYPETTLASAREKGREARAHLGRDIDPIEHRKQQQQQQWLTDAKNLTFKEIADKLFAKKTAGDNPWWGSKYAAKNQWILDGSLKTLHNLPINSPEAAEAITLRLHDILEPKWLKTPPMARDIKYLAAAICEYAYGLKVLPANVANPAGRPLEVLLGERQRQGGQRYAIAYDKVPALYAKLDELSKPVYSHFTVREAARATGVHPAMINLDITESRLPATKSKCPFKNLIGWEWHIEPADLFKLRPKVMDVIPGVRPVAMHLVKFAVLNGCRPSEAREMTWSEYDPIERLWILPWQRTKEGKDIRRDLVIPLSQLAIDILDAMKAQQQRDQIKTDYVFAGYPSRFNKWAVKIGETVCVTTLLNNLRKALPPEEIKATMHGMRTAFRSWGEDQRRFDEKDLERAIGHAAGFGATEVSRLYSRQASRIAALIPIFDGWANFVSGGGLPADVIPFRRQARSATGG
jgi:hypothetical protein